MGEVCCRQSAAAGVLLEEPFWVDGRDRETIWSVEAWRAKGRKERRVQLKRTVMAAIVKPSRPKEHFFL